MEPFTSSYYRERVFASHFFIHQIPPFSMNRTFLSLVSRSAWMLALTFVCAVMPILAQSGAKEASDPASKLGYDAFKLRPIGPAITSGRISSIAVHPAQPSVWYVAAASGGVWKTVNAGITWQPVFENEGSYSIGCVTVDPANPHTVWVGTGENNSQRSVGYGDGIYRSDDGGKSWKNMGLKTSEHIARILVDPRNSNVVYVAAQGPLWSAGGERGLYKSTDGGKTWKASLTISENTGVTDVVFDPRNPDILYAASYQRRRHAWTLIDGGPECTIYKSTDGGASWQKAESGLPAGQMGRIGLTIAPSNPDVLYAHVEAANKKGGIFRSADRGATWEKRNSYETTMMYYATIYADPKNADRIYVMNFNIMVSDDGGTTLKALGTKSKHVDNHAMWIDPENTNHYLVGCDGGLYETFDRAQNWRHTPNLPITQFYRVSVDNALPFYGVYGGTQDNFSLGGPSRTITQNGITNYDWFVTQGGDGFQSQIDPKDPNIVYAEFQNGGLARFDKKSGERIGIVAALKTAMQESSERLDFEEAGLLRNRMKELERIFFRQRQISSSINENNVIIIVPTEERDKKVEVFFIRHGRLHFQRLVGKKLPVKELERALESVYFDGTDAPPHSRKEEIDEIRIIASWIYQRRNDGIFLYMHGKTATNALDELAELLYKALATPQTYSAVQEEFP